MKNFKYSLYAKAALRQIHCEIQHKIYKSQEKWEKIKKDQFTFNTITKDFHMVDICTRHDNKEPKDK